MPTPLAPDLERGALLRFDAGGPTGLEVRFQYNPATLHRRLTERRAGVLQGRRRLQPRETIRLELLFDATDALETPDDHPAAVSTGVLPQLSALELLMRPSRARSGFWDWLRPSGSRADPYTVFQWGQNRILPVRLTSLRAREELFGPELQPLRATATVGMDVLTDADLPTGHPARRIWDDHLERQRAQRNGG